MASVDAAHDSQTSSEFFTMQVRNVYHTYKQMALVDIYSVRFLINHYVYGPVPTRYHW